jgi:tagatose-6-phosphate ketose/aldose isomerase
MKYLGIAMEDLLMSGAVHTAREISQQPELWTKVYGQAITEKKRIMEFYEQIRDVQRIILAGAGTSAFIGLSLRGTFQRARNIVTDVISTTDLVSHPKDYFHPTVPTLVISFARSGNSPESVGAVSLADELCETCYHLIITCNSEGLLANYKSKNKKYVFTLPAEANDQSLAMTSSYTGMLLAGKLLSNISAVESYASDLSAIITSARCIPGFRPVLWNGHRGTSQTPGTYRW